MTEYWVSKKQYWCKYCSIYIRDDAPSRRQHETGLRHIGAKERFIRDLYKTGNMAKRGKEQEAQEMARINAAAQAAHAQDVGVAGPSRQSLLYTLNHANAAASGSGPKRPSKPTDKFANYSTAAQLGLVEEDSAPTSYEVEQMVRNRDTSVGKWEEVAVEPTESHSVQGLGPREEEDEEGEGWKFQHKGKRPVRDPYDDDDFDPSAVLKMRKRVKSEGKMDPNQPPERVSDAGIGRNREGMLDRGAWSGKIELNGDLSTEKKDGLIYQAGGGWVKLEDGNETPPADKENDVKITQDPSHGSFDEAGEKMDVKPDASLLGTNPPDVAETKPVVPDAASAPAVSSHDQPTPTEAPSGLFKKRRPPPSSRKK